MAAGDVITIIESPLGRKGNYFDGTDDYVLHDAHAVARVAANDTTGTYSAWIYLDDLAANHCILSAGVAASATEFMRAYVSTTGAIIFNLKVGSADQFTLTQTSGLLTARRWYHVALVQNGTQPVIYVDGAAVTASNTVSTDLTAWYDELTACDKFAIGVVESNNTHTADFAGAIGQVKYWNKALTATEVKSDYNGTALSDDGTYLQFNITMENNGTTDSGLGADDGTLTGNAHYGGVISPWSYAVERNSTGHAAEFINTFPLSQDTWVSVIKRGD